MILAIATHISLRENVFGQSPFEHVWLVTAAAFVYDHLLEAIVFGEFKLFL